MTEALYILLGVVLGAAFGWLWATRRVGASRATEAELRDQLEGRAAETGALRAELDREQEARVAAETRVEEALKGIAEQRKLLEEARKELTDTFQALASKALQASKEDFLQLATESLGKREESIKGLVAPVQETLKRYEEQLRDLEKSRKEAYGSLQEQLRAVGVTQQELHRETGRLVTALRHPGVRGRWGEVTLRRVVELAGMTEHCDFTEQTAYRGGEGRLLPDLVVHLPGDRRIAVDAKVPLDDYLQAVSEPTEEKRGEAFARHARKLREHVRSLASKGYWDAMGADLELVVLFVPGEAFLSAALLAEGSLFEEALEKKVLLASPTNLIALLRAVAYGWRQEQVAANALQVSELGKQLHDRLRTFAGHLAKVGGALGRAVGEYNRAVGSLESRILPSARRFQELGAATGAAVEELKPVEEAPRGAQLPDAGGEH